MLAPPTTDPPAGADVVPAGAPAAVVAAGVAAVVPPVVVGVGLVLEHPAIATPITTNIMTMILICEIFKTTPPDTRKFLTASSRQGNSDVGIEMVIYIQLY